MRPYPKVISVVVREIVHLLLPDRDIENADAEMVFSQIMREYLGVNNATREKMREYLISSANKTMREAERPGFDSNEFDEVIREMADTGFKVSDVGFEHIVNQRLEFLLISCAVEEVSAPESALRTKISAVIKDHLKNLEKLDVKSGGSGTGGGGGWSPPGVPPGGTPPSGAPATLGRPGRIPPAIDPSDDGFEVE